MTMRGFSIAALLALSALWLPLATQAQVVEVAGVKYEPTADVGGSKLQLNGAGVRYKAIFKVYTAGLYLSSKSATTEAVISAPGAKRIHVVMLREIDSNELGKLFTKGVEQNAPRDEFAKSIPGLLRFSEVFASRKSLSTGDNFTVDYVPGVGSVLQVNGKTQGEPVKEPEFFSALMRIWLGKSPADDQLKDALLGIVKKSGRER